MARCVWCFIFVLAVADFAESAEAKTTELKRRIADLQASDPKSPKLADMYFELALRQNKTVEIMEAEAALKQARTVAEATFKSTPTEATRTALVDIVEAQGHLAKRMQLWKETQAHVQTGLAFAKQIGDTEAGQLMESRFRYLAAQQFAQQMKHDETADQGTALLAWMEQVQQRYPKSVAVRKLYISELQFFGRILTQIGRASEAIPYATKAAVLAKELHEATPDDDELLNLYCTTTNDSALAFRECGLFIEAEKRYAAAMVLAKKRLAGEPQSSRKKRTLLAIYQNYGAMVGPSIPDEVRLQHRDAEEQLRLSLPPQDISDDHALSESLVRAGNSIFGDSTETIADTQAYYEAMVKLRTQHPNVPLFGTQAAQSATMIWAKEGQQGLTSNVRTLMADTRATLTQLIEADPNTPQYQYLFLSFNMEEAFLAIQRGTVEESRRLFAVSRDSWKDFIAKHPKNPAFSKLISEVMLLPFDQAMQRQDAQLAQEIGRFILEQRQALVKQYPREQHYRRTLAVVWSHVAGIYHLTQSREGVDFCLRRAVQDWEALIKEHPQPDYVLQLVDAHRMVAQWYNHGERYKEAIQSYAVAIKLAQEAYQAAPAHTFFGERLADLNWFASRSALNNQQVEVAVDLMTAGLQAREQTIAQHPKWRRHYESLRVMYKERALLYNRLGKTDLYDADWKKADAADAAGAKLTAN